MDEGRRAQIVQHRIEQLRTLLRARGAAAVLLDARRDFAWLTLGGQNHVLLTTETGVAPVLITNDDAVVIAPVNEYDRLVDEELQGLPIRAISVPWWDTEAVSRETSSVIGGGELLAAKDVADELEPLRTALVPEEHERMEWLGDVVNTTLGEALEAAKAGDSESSLGGDVDARLADSDVRLPVILVAADERISRFRHPIATETRIRGRVMVVVVAERWGLHVAATQFREFEPVGGEVRERAAAIDHVVDAMRAASSVGNTLGDVLAAARAAYTERGLENEWTLHHQGGSIGYAARERIATPGDETPIRPGMAFAWNPSAVGYKAEQTLYLDEDGGQHILTNTNGPA